MRLILITLLMAGCSTAQITGTVKGSSVSPPSSTPPAPTIVIDTPASQEIAPAASLPFTSTPSNGEPPLTYTWSCQPTTGCPVNGNTNQDPGSQQFNTSGTFTITVEVCDALARCNDSDPVVITVTPGDDCYLENGVQVCPTLGTVILSEDFESGSTTLTASSNGGTCSFGDAVVTTTESRGVYAGGAQFYEGITGPCGQLGGTTTAHQDRNSYHQKDYGSGNGYTELWIRGWFYFGAINWTYDPLDQVQRKTLYTNPSLSGQWSSTPGTRECSDGVQGLYIPYVPVGLGLYTLEGGDNELPNQPSLCGGIVEIPFDDWVYIEFHYKNRSSSSATDSELHVWVQKTADPLPVMVFKKTAFRKQFNIASAVRASNVSTYTTTEDHGLSTGNQVQVYQMTPSTFNRTPCTITVTGARTFTCANSGVNESATGLGYTGQTCFTGKSFTCPPFPTDPTQKIRIIRWGNQVDRSRLYLFDEWRYWDDLALSDDGWIGPNQ